MNKEQEEKSLAYQIVEDYKRSNKRKDIMIFVLLGIIALFVGGLVYFISSYDLSYEETIVETGTGNAIMNGEGSVNAENTSN